MAEDLVAVVVSAALRDQVRDFPIAEAHSGVRRRSVARVLVHRVFPGLQRVRVLESDRALDRTRDQVQESDQGLGLRRDRELVVARVLESDQDLDLQHCRDLDPGRESVVVQQRVQVSAIGLVSDNCRDWGVVPVRDCRIREPIARKLSKAGDRT
ncbi:MAG: hypothetical protein ACI93T_000589 [Porticoccaceae bacterium]